MFGGDFLAVMEYLMERCNIEELELAGVIASDIWKRRNSVLHGGTLYIRIVWYKERRSC